MTPEPPRTSQPQLVRAIGRWSMVALAVNSILGSGIFGLPSVVAGLLGHASPAAVLIAGAGMAVIIACYAEVASQFTETGGTYLYVRHTFGRFAGVQVGWLMLLSRLTACAAGVNLLVIYLGEFWPAATQPLPRLSVISVFLASLAAVNYRGVAAGTLVSNASVVAKLAALGMVCVAGVLYLSLHPRVAAAPVAASVDGWLQAMLLLLFAYGGYEAALNPMGEARDPRRDAAFALFVALLILTALYALLQLIVVGVLADAAHSARPLADAARVVIGPAGAALISDRAARHLRARRAGRLPGLVRPRAPALSHPVLLDPGIRAAAVGFFPVRELLLERHAVGGGAAVLLRGGVCGGTGSAPQASRGRALASARRTDPSAPRRDHLCRAPHAGGFQQIAHPPRHDRRGVRELARGQAKRCAGGVRRLKATARRAACRGAARPRHRRPRWASQRAAF